MRARAAAASALAALALVAACGGSGGQAGGSPSGSPQATSTSTHDRMDQPVPTPSGFPSDLPVYPGARLTAAAPFTSSGLVTFGMEWETLDGVDKVHAFYASKLNQGDWTISFSGTTAAGFNAVFSRKSNSRVIGTVGADGSSGVTKISLSLVMPG